MTKHNRWKTGSKRRACSICNVMVKTMITQKDIRALTFHRTRFGRIATWIVFIFPIFCFIMGALNLHVAAKIGRYSGHDLGSLFHSWFKGVEVDK